jgi:hypothetical protein
MTLVPAKMILAHDKKIVVLARMNDHAMMTAVRITAHARMIAGIKTTATTIMGARMIATIVDAKTIMMIIPAATMMSVIVMTMVVSVVTASPPPTSTPHVKYVTFMGIMLVTAGGAMAMIMATMVVTKVPMLLPMV